MSPLSLAIVIAVLAAVPAHAAEPLATCPADLAAVDASFAETQARLDKVTQADKVELCAAIKHHIEVMANGIAVFDRCMENGHDKGENIAQLEASIDDFLYINENQGCAPVTVPPSAAPQ
ncbi:MAG: hypothetical protein WDM94_13090 [Bauldia sp.]